MRLTFVALFLRPNSILHTAFGTAERFPDRFHGVVMPAYVLANIRTSSESPGLAEYRRRVQSTLDPFEGHFVIRGGKVEVVEGNWHPVHLSVIEFPDGERMRGWLDSAAYREVLPLRTDSVETDLVTVENH